MLQAVVIVRCYFCSAPNWPTSCSFLNWACKGKCGLDSGETLEFQKQPFSKSSLMKSGNGAGLRLDLCSLGCQTSPALERFLLLSELLTEKRIQDKYSTLSSEHDLSLSPSLSLSLSLFDAFSHVHPHTITLIH